MNAQDPKPDARIVNSVQQETRRALTTQQTTRLMSAILPFRNTLGRVRHASAVAAPSNTPYRVFDRYAKYLQRERAVRKNAGESSRRVDYIRDEVADRMLERFEVRYLKLQLRTPISHSRIRI